MARNSSPGPGDLRSRLSSCSDYLEAIAELRTKLLHSSPSYLISKPEELISLVEVAKNTLQSNGVKLHTFSSCPDYLSAYKAAYFGLLRQLQAHSYHIKLDSKYLQGRLSRLLFPLSTQLKVCSNTPEHENPGDYVDRACGVKRAGNDSARDSSKSKGVSSSIDSSSGDSRFPGNSVTARAVQRINPPVLPPNVMLPPPLPLPRPVWASESGQSLEFIASKPLSSRLSRELPKLADSGCRVPAIRRRASHDTVHFKRRHAEPVTSSTTQLNSAAHKAMYGITEGSKSCTSFSLGDDNSDEMPMDETDSSDSSSDGDDGEDSGSVHVVVPSNSPLRRSFGIFCTGKGRGAFSNSLTMTSRRSQPNSEGSKLSLKRALQKDAMDVDP